MSRWSRRCAVVAAAALVAGVLVVGSAPSGAAGPLAYTTVSTDGCQLATVDLTTGVVTPLSAGPTGNACVDDLAVAPNGTVYGLRDIPDSGMSANLVTFDPTTGAVTSATPFSGSFTQSFTAHGGITVDKNGVVYASFVTNQTGCSDLIETAVVCLYRVDPATAAATLIGNAGATKNQVRTFFLTVSCAGSMLTGESTPIQGGSESVTNETTTPASDESATTTGEPSEPITTLPDFSAFSDDVGALATGLNLASVSATTGAVTTGPSFAVGFNVLGIAFANPAGTLYALGTPAAGAPGVYTIDPTTAAATLVAPLSGITAVDNLAIAGTCPVQLAAGFAG